MFVTPALLASCLLGKHLFPPYFLAINFKLHFSKRMLQFYGKVVLAEYEL